VKKARIEDLYAIADGEVKPEEGSRPWCSA
jgi:hypothetical protein